VIAYMLQRFVQAMLQGVSASFGNEASSIHPPLRQSRRWRCALPHCRLKRHVKCSKTPEILQNHLAGAIIRPEFHASSASGAEKSAFPWGGINTYEASLFETRRSCGIRCRDRDTAIAHHAFQAEFDGNLPIMLQGKVTKVGVDQPAHLGAHGRGHGWGPAGVDDRGGHTEYAIAPRDQSRHPQAGRTDHCARLSRERCALRPACKPMAAT